MANKEIKTQIVINASAETVWKVLTKFEDYKNWNSFISSISGEVKEGNHINVTAGGMKFKPLVLTYRKNREIRWIGKLFFTGLFDGEHSFKIEENTDGTITFRQEETFHGILVGLFSKKLDTDTKNGFIQMNQKLKKLSEEIQMT